MDPQPLVDRQIDAGEWLLGGLAAQGVPIQYAYWGRPIDRDRWSLTIATPIVDERGWAASYRAVYDVLRASDESALTDSDITLARPDERMATRLAQDRLLVPGTPTRQTLLGPDGAEEVGYVYPPVPPTASHTGLTAEQKQLLIDLYFQTPLSVDDLPYTEDMERLHARFASQTGSALTIRDLYKALKNLGRQGRLAGKRRPAGGSVLPALTAPA